MYKTYIYQLQHKTSGALDSIYVWSDSEKTAYDAAFNTYGQNYNIFLCDIKLNRFYSGISTD